MSLPPALQNQKVQIGIIVAALVVALAFVIFQVIGSNQQNTEGMVAMGSSPYGGPPGMPGAMPGPGGPGMGPPGGPMPGGPGMMGGPGGMMPGGVSGYGTDSGMGTDAAAAPEVKPKKAGPRPPTRTDPFKTPKDQMPEPYPIADALPPDNLYIERRQEELLAPTVEQFVRDVPDPPMRMAGALWGNRVYGVLEINGQTQVVNPGDKVGIYRVERVERDRIIMSRPSRKGRRMVEAQLGGNPALANQYPTDPGVPGGPAGYGAPGMPGGPVGGGRTGG